MLNNSVSETQLGPIPSEWEIIELGEVASLTMGQSPPSSTYNSAGIGLPFLQGKAEFGKIYPTPIKWCSEPQKLAKSGSILISVRAPVGDVNVAKDEVCIGRGLASIDGNELLDNWFLFFQLAYSKNRLEERGTGSTFKSINKGVLQEFHIPLPPLPEQRAIAHVLSTLRQSIEATKTVITAARELKQSMMKHLLTYGPVPIDNTDQVSLKDSVIGEVPDAWDIVELDELVTQKITDGTHKTPSYLDVGVPFVTAKDISGGRLDFSDCKFISIEEHEELCRRVKPERDDILLSKVGTLGYVAQIDVDIDFSIFVQLALIKPDREIVIPNYLKFALLSSNVQEEIIRTSSQSTMKYIGVGKIAQLHIPKPSKKVQADIQCILELVDDKLSSEEQRKSALEALFNSLLHHLMTGKVRVQVD